MTPFGELLHQHVAASLDKQLALADRLGQHRWEYTTGTGTLAFTLDGGARLELAAEVLGTVSREHQSWLWAWAETSPLPERLLAASESLRALGEQAGVDELTTAELMLDHVDPQSLAFVASGALAAQAFYRGPQADGSVYLLIRDLRLPRAAEPPAARVARIFPRLAGLAGLEHRRAFLPYLEWHGLAVAARNGTVRGTAADGGSVSAAFDKAGRLTGIELSA